MLSEPRPFKPDLEELEGFSHQIGLMSGCTDKLNRMRDDEMLSGSTLPKGAYSTRRVQSSDSQTLYPAVLNFPPRENRSTLPVEMARFDHGALGVKAELLLRLQLSEPLTPLSERARSSLIVFLEAEERKKYCAPLAV